MKKRRLTESQVSLIALSLRIAMNHYNSDAHAMTEAQHPRLAAQFDQQYKDAQILAVMFEDMPTSVEVTE